MLSLDQLHHLLVDLALGLGRAGQRGVAAQILVVHGLQRHHVKVLAHAVAGEHGAGKLGGLLDIVGGTGGDGSEHHFLGGASAGEGGDLVFQLFLAHQVVVALVHLHGVTQCAGGAGDNGDLLHRGRVGLLGRHQCMADLVVGHDALFLVGEDGVLLLVACNDHLDALLQIGLSHALAACTHGAQGCFVDDVGKFRTGCTGSHAGHGVEVDARGQRHLFGVHFQNLFAALEVGQLHRHAAVKASGTGQGRVQRIRAVGGRQNDDAGVALKAVHLGEQLVQSLLTLVVATEIAAVALLTDGIDLIDEHNAGGLFLGLPEQVAHLGCAHAHEHLHEFRAGNGEEGHIGFACHGLSQHGLAGARRAHQQDALWHGCANALVLAGVVQIIHDLLQVFLGFILTGHIRKADAVGGLHIDLGVGLAHAAEHHGPRAAAGLFHQLFVHLVADETEQQDGQHKPDQEIEHRRPLLHDLAGKLCSGIIQALGKLRVIHQASLVDLLFLLIGKNDLIGLDIHTADVLFLGHGHKGTVVHFLHLTLAHPRQQHKVEQQQDRQHDGVVDRQRLFGRFDFFHVAIPPLVPDASSIAQ